MVPGYLPGKNEFTVIDLGNNAASFGLWSAPVDWKQIFRSPDYFLENLVSDEEIEQNFKYEMPADLRKKFAKSKDVSFDVEENMMISFKKDLNQRPFWNVPLINIPGCAWRTVKMSLTHGCWLKNW